MKKEEIIYDRNTNVLINALQRLMRVLVSGGIAVVILSFVCLFYSYSGIHIANSSGATDYTWEPGQWKATMTEGFSWFCMDENGFNNSEACKDYGMDVLLMGASHMEAVNIAQKDNTGTLLNESGISAYNIGTSAHDIYTCVNNVGAAYDAYAPQKAMVIQTDNISLSLDAMQQVIDGTHERIPSYDTGIVYQMQKIPAIKVLYKQLDSWIGASRYVDSEAAVISMQEDEASAENQRVLSKFLTLARENVKDTACKLIILYTPTFSVSEDGEMYFNTNTDDYNMFKNICDDIGITFVDMTEEFKTEYRENNRLVYGFANTVPGEGHLNKYGHKLMADELYRIIEEGQ